MTTPSYEELLRKEAEVWNRAAETQACASKPDWRSLRQQRQNWFFHRQHVDALLEEITPGMRMLDLGCGSGYLSLAAAQRGAVVLGIDIADRAIEIARSYAEELNIELPGRASFQVADLNQLVLPEGHFDIITAKGVLHHLVQSNRVIERVYRALKPGGLFWISDTYAAVPRRTALMAGLFFFMMPVQTPYHEKLKAFIQLGVRSIGRMQASMQAEGLSPFEGAGIGPNWLGRAEDLFVIKARMEHPAITGYLASQIAGPDWFSFPVLSLIRRLDSVLVRLHLLASNAATLYAYKPEDIASHS